ncbi:MAG: hypothetical protein V3T53_15165 [Phycisphaerales bacterium]
MQLTQRILGHCLIVSVVIAVTCTTLATQPVEQEKPRATESEEIARIIANLPGWPHDRDLTNEEWRLYLMSAIALQKTPPETVREAMRTYKTFMQRYREAWNIKPAILLRVMFDIPEDFELPSYPYGVRPSGGIPGMPVVGGTTTRNLVSPVRWTPEGPTLLAYAPIAIGNGSVPSIPVFEYEYFHKHFKQREGLDDLVDVEISDWKDLLPILGDELTLRHRNRWSKKVWLIDASENLLQVVIQRRDEQTVAVSIEHNVRTIEDSEAMTFRVFDPEDSRHVLTEFRLERGALYGLGVRARSIQLPEGRRIKIEMFVEGRLHDSRIFWP